MLALHRGVFCAAFPELQGIVDDKERLGRLEKVGIAVCRLFSFGQGGFADDFRVLRNEPTETRTACLIGMQDRYATGKNAGASIIEIELTADELRAQFEALATQYAWPGWKEVWDELLRDPPPTSPPTLP